MQGGGLASAGVVNVLFAYIEVDISESQMSVANIEILILFIFYI